jgi:two-component system response regulator RegA
MLEAAADLLLVDDDDNLRGVLTRALARRGFAVRAAANAEEALDMARARCPAYAVVDLKLPGLSGLALVPELKRLSPQMRILVLTGYASIATAVEAIKLGATHYLPKPADADEVAAALGRAAGDAKLEVEPEPLSVDRLEWEHIQKVLAAHDGNISATARALKMHRRTLQRKLAKKPVAR